MDFDLSLPRGEEERCRVALAAGAAARSAGAAAPGPARLPARCETCALGQKRSLFTSVPKTQM